MTQETETMLTPGEVAAMFRVDSKTVTRWANAGKLTSFRTLGGHRRYKEAEVRALLAGSSENRVTDPMAAPVHTLWPSGRPATLARILLDEGVTTVGKLTALSAAGLRALGFRPPQVDGIRLALSRKGLALHGEVLDTAA